MSERSEVQVPRLKDHFGELLTALVVVEEPERIEGIFFGLGLLAVQAIVSELHYGSPPEGDLAGMFDQLNKAINFDIRGNEQVSARLSGILSVVAAAATRAVPQLGEADFMTLLQIKERGRVPLDEVKDFVYPPVPPPEQKGSLTVMSVPAENDLVTVRRIGRQTMVEISGRGRDALIAYFSRTLAS